MVPTLIFIWRNQWWCALCPFLTEISFLGKFDTKFQIYCLKWNLVPTLIRIWRVQWYFLLLCFELGIPFLANLVQKIKNVSLKWNFVLRLSQIRGTQWWCSFFLFLIGSIIFGGKFISKNQYCLLKLKFRAYTNSNM